MSDDTQEELEEGMTWCPECEGARCVHVGGQPMHCNTCEGRGFIEDPNTEEGE